MIMKSLNIFFANKLKRIANLIKKFILILKISLICKLFFFIILHTKIYYCFIIQLMKLLFYKLYKKNYKVKTVFNISIK